MTGASGSRARVWIHVIGLAVLLAHLIVALSGQTQDAINATVAAHVDALEARVGQIEMYDLPQAVAVLQAEVGEMKWLIRGVFTAMAGLIFQAIADAVRGYRTNRRR